MYTSQDSSSQAATVNINSGEIHDEIITRSHGEICLNKKSRSSPPTSFGDAIPTYGSISKDSQSSSNSIERGKQPRINYDHEVDQVQEKY